MRSLIIYILLLSLTTPSLRADEGTIEAPGEMSAEQSFPTSDDNNVIRQNDPEPATDLLPPDQFSECHDTSIYDPEPVGVAAAQSAEEPVVSNKTWRRLALITAGVAVAALAIYSVNRNQGKEVF